MVHPLVVGTDGSDTAFRALDWAADEAARHGLPLRVVYASRWERFEGTVPPDGGERPSEQVLAESVVASAAEVARRKQTDIEISGEVLATDAITALLNEGLHATALILGSRGRGEIAGLLLGSVSLAVSARARCPVIVVRGDVAGLAGTHGRILLTVADPAAETAAVRFAFREAAARQCTLEAVCAWPLPVRDATEAPLLAADARRYHEKQASALLDEALDGVVAEYPAVRVRRVTVEGPAHKVLVHRTAAADLLVTGAQQRHGHFGLQLGRLAHTALCHATCPVAVVPQQV
ncbi:universal stress protein [Streptomyces tubercidicus]|uniref:Universal stress protein n=1 Tax=Streptomyces tubercidicus TaxID=47759 RepID=A0A640V6H0_9ACTN|nr:universal stress protein [Streptomyces tubercidicus]WAU15884.1 universal stress protein [Streptomyces tubercidicus]GFE41776.1 universal stress protein [Streptomyces tubercidicus]